MPDNVIIGPWGAGDEDEGRRPDPAADLDAWADAVRHLHAEGLPAPAPELTCRALRRRGIRPDWTAA